jgi:very-short-patch-repair endonuclease
VRRADREAAELALRQQGAFASWQLDAAGVAMGSRKVRLASGTWIRVLPGVYVLPSAPPTFEQRLWIGWLAAGPQAIVSHEAAAQLRKIPNVVRDRITLTVQHSGYHRIPGVIVHQISDVLDDHVGELGGWRVTTVPRTIVDLAAVVSPVRLRSIVEESKLAGLTTPVAVGECLATVARRGKPGVRSLARVLDVFGDGKETSNSKLEDALRDVIRAFDLPVPAAQFPFPGRQFVKGCVDFAYPDVKLVIEADGRRWHTRIRDIGRDHERDGDAAEAGWQTLRLLYEHIVGDPEGTARRIRAVLEQRRMQLAS